MNIEATDLVKASEMPPNSETVGGYLQSMRQQKGMELSNVSEITKYSIHQLECIEDHKWSDLPSGFVLRSIVRKFAVAVDADPEIAIEKLAQVTGNAAPPSSKRNITANFDTPINKKYEEKAGWFSWSKLLVFVLLLAIIGISIYLLANEDFNALFQLEIFKKWFS